MYQKACLWCRDVVVVTVAWALVVVGGIGRKDGQKELKKTYSDAWCLKYMQH